MRSPRTGTGTGGRHRSRTSTAFLLTAVLGTALLAGAPAALAAEPDTDLTGNGGVLTAQFPESGDESEHRLIDNDVTTKYFTPRPTVWMQYRSTVAATLDHYTLTSADDAPDRDPRDWVLEGSRDGTGWTVLDSRQGETFSGRNQTREFSVDATTAYTYYRLTVTRNNGSPGFQLAEWELWAAASGAPGAPGGLAASLDGEGTGLLTWKDGSGTETGFRIERSQDGSAFVQVGSAEARARSFRDPGLTPGVGYSYRVRAVGADGEPSDYSAPRDLRIGVADITDLPGTVSDQYGREGTEGHDRSADNSPYSKYLAWGPATWLQYRTDGRSKVTSYTVTSANDAPDRDPRDWVLRGSDDGTTWTALDTRSGEDFANRFQKKSYSLTSPGYYRYYRLDITANHGASSTQLAEWELTGTANTAASGAAPEAPTALTATPRSGDQISLSWAGGSRDQQSLRLERSDNGTDWNWSRILPAATTTYTDLGLRGDSTYHYRLRAQNTGGASPYTTVVRATTGSSALPATWQEHWLEHNQLLTKVYDANDVVIYFDQDMDRSQTWLNDYVSRLWKYTKQTYGDFSSGRLVAVFHKDKYSGGHPATVLEGSHDYRNVIDVGSGGWDENDGTIRDVISHEIAHVVEGSSGGVKGSPAFGLWRDSKWAEIYQYDTYLGAGLRADAQRFYAQVIDKKDGFPRADTAWFRDWFLPIRQNHGGSKPLAAFFSLVSQRYAQYNGAFAKDMNMGEFVHFWSGAAGTDLTDRAKTAFGWTDAYEAQLRQARLDYPGLPYTTG
ncbi:fibronectin type III domain-containing protein [Streptomyces sp. ME03-5684b]|uniref:fibronectin type III domain-containing protein n=1 Tax=Streptomyces sp. ME03-5684b TaxID=3028681 RepID=UPI0029AD5199|nr:fibronectin type III domain-containing protein [Streptomyces sp. ME03-5684b]MDX3319688.1 fibronectin type III domain-containing protein [Streptomyces sp. ME03-5684b]